MLKRGIAAGVWSALLSGLLTGGSAWAKPADLPSNQNQIECSGEDDVPTRKLSLKLGLGSKGIFFEMEEGAIDPAPALDPLLPAFIEQMLQHAADAISRPERTADLGYLLGKVPFLGSLQTEPVPAVETPKVAGGNEAEKQIRNLFEKADYYGRMGVNEAARFLYQRVHLLSPTSRLGQLAIERLQELENRLRDASEPQENPEREDMPEPMRRDVRNGTIPLGLVQVAY